MTTTQRTPSNRLHLMVLVVVLTLVTVACAGGATGGTSTTATTDTSVPPDVGATTTAAPATTQVEVERIRFGWIPGITGGAIAAIAETQGLWEKYGLEVELVEFNAGSPLVTAMAAGQLDVGYIGNGAMWGPAQGLATILVPDELSLETFILAQPDSGIESIEDLAGHSIGLPEGSAGDLLLTAALNRVGLTEDDVEKVPMDPPTLVAAFSAGQIEAAAIWTPPAAQIEEAVPDVVRLAGNRDFPDEKFFGAIIVNNEFLDVNPAALDRFLRVFIEANDFRHDNMDEAVAITSEFTGLPVEALADAAENVEWFSSEEFFEITSSGEFIDWVESLMTLQAQVGNLDEIPDAAAFVNVDPFIAAFESN